MKTVICYIEAQLISGKFGWEMEVIHGNELTIGEISVNQWVSITCTVRRSNVSLYLNGASDLGA